MNVAVPYLPKAGGLKEKSVNPESFKRRGRKVLLKEIVIMAEARRRVGTHSVLQRSEVSGSTKKMYAQKHTGRARHGSAKPQQFRGGGVAFAKKPRDYGYSLPIRARRAALCAAIRGKLEDGEVKLVEKFAFPKPSTKGFLELLKRLGVENQSFLVVPAAHAEPLRRSCRNLPRSAYRIAADLSAYEVLKQKFLILEEAALASLEERFSHG